MKKCDNCGKETDNLIECPECNSDCCDDCIAGKGVDCFSCEELNGDEEE